ncbi:MAG: NAD(P)H-hydrate dehydratase [Chloroflexi bacterium]|nr:NAD(P)H-hydrate dehydratase [Chloroflexota bacterium]
MKLYSVAQMVAAEKAADAAGHSYAQMMEIAGRSVAEAIMARWPVAEARILVLVGPGNNGGDGLVAGRYLAQASADVAFYLYKPRDLQTDENFAQIQQMGLFIVEASFDQRYRVLRTRLNSSHILIDALLGTGVSRPIGGNLAQLMQQLRVGWQDDKVTLPHYPITSLPHHPPPSSPHPLITVAVDCPSGLNCDTGELDKLALPADLTVTFAGPKRGHFKFPGAAACGELVVADIGIAADLPAVQDVNVELMTAVKANHLLPPRPIDGHKGTFGKVLIAAGCDRYQGAPVLAARGAFRAGAGLVALAVPEVVRQSAVISLPEATYPEVADERVLSAKSAKMLLATIDQHDALLLGPGLGEAADFVTALLAAETLPPLLVDADGLNILAQMENWPSLLPPRTVLTPHPAEMSRLMGISLKDMLAQDRLKAAQTQAQTWGHIVLLKGAYTIVAAPTGEATLIPFASPVLAVGGSGDVLGGVIATLLAQGLGGYDAAVLGSYLHGAVGSLTKTQSGLLASEIADLLPEVAQHIILPKTSSLSEKSRNLVLK